MKQMKGQLFLLVFFFEKLLVNENVSMKKSILKVVRKDSVGKGKNEYFLDS